MQEEGQLPDARELVAGAAIRIPFGFRAIHGEDHVITPKEMKGMSFVKHGD